MRVRHSNPETDTWIQATVTEPHSLRISVGEDDFVADSFSLHLVDVPLLLNTLLELLAKDKND